MEISNRFLLSLLEKQHIWVYCGIISFCFVLFALWLKRKRKVNCWFCRKNSYVVKSELSWWFCRYCEQFNGFDQSGDYIREIPNMFTVSDGCPRYCNNNEAPKYTEKKQLCERCQKNQTLKLAKLQAFEPSNESTFDWESAEYENYLNERFKLCSHCRALFNDEIARQDGEIKEMYSEELEKLRPSSQSFRRLKRKNNNRWSFVLRKLSPLCIFFLSLLILVLHEKKIEPSMKKISLLSATISALIFNMMLTKVRKQLQWLQMVSYALWSNLLYSTFYEKEHSLFFSQMMILIESLSIFLQSWSFLCRKWKERRYMRERKNKLGNLTPNRTVLLEGDDHSKLGDLSVSENVSVLSDDFNSSFNSGSVTNELMNAPDLLQGNLHRMYIGRKGNKEPASDQRTTNHVVAALKYKSRSMPLLPTVTSANTKRPLLRPATFVYKKEQTDLNKTEANSDVAVERTREVSRFQEIKEDRDSNTSTTATEDLIPDMQCDHEKNKTSIFSWSIMYIIFFIVSVVLNIVFITLYKYEKKEK